MQYYESFLKRMERKKSWLGPTESYGAKLHHRYWCDVNNLGVTNYGIHPKYLPVSIIRYDVMHMNMAINRSCMTYTYKFVMSPEQLFIDTFNNHICISWG